MIGSRLLQILGALVVISIALLTLTIYLVFWDALPPATAVTQHYDVPPLVYEQLNKNKQNVTINYESNGNDIADNPSQEVKDEMMTMKKMKFNCLQKANDIEIRPFQLERKQNQLPQFASIVLSRNRHNNDDDDSFSWFAIFSLVEMVWKLGGRHRKRIPKWTTNATWYCNGRPGIVVAKGCAAGSTLVVQCPQENALDNAIQEITVYNYTYKVDLHVQCQIDHYRRQQKYSTLSSNIHHKNDEKATAKIAATALLFRDMARDPFALLQWTEYHRFIGVQHFYVYLAEIYSNDDNGNDWLLPDLPYITYIPWYLLTLPPNQQKEFDMFTLQVSHQMDALYQSRAEGMDWLAYNDLDEFIQLMNTTTSHNQSLVSLLNHIVGSSHPDLGGVMGLTIHFGNHDQPDLRLSEPPRLLFDYVYRTASPILVRRQKCLVRPNKIDYYNIHKVSVPNDNDADINKKTNSFVYELDPWNELRFNHYKTPFEGIYARWCPNATKVLDTNFRDTFRTNLDAEISRILTKENK